MLSCSVWFSALNVLAGVLGSKEAGLLHSIEAVIGLMTCLPASQDSSQHIKCRKSCAATQHLILLMIGVYT